MSGGPVSPDEVEEAPLAAIPSEVFDVVNDLIRENMKNGRAYFRQGELVDRLVAKNAVLYEDEAIDKGWLDFEPHYEALGWKVEYQGGHWTDNCPRAFVFSKNKQ